MGVSVFTCARDMLPSLAGLKPCNLKYCQPVGVILPTWGARDEALTDEQKDRVPSSYNESRTECAICWNELRKDKEDEETGDKRVLTIVDFEGACGHSFHVSCLSRWLDERNNVDQTLRCPVCKDPILDAWVDRTYNRIRGKRQAPQQRDGRGREAVARVNPAVLLLPNGLQRPDGRMPEWRVILRFALDELKRMRDEIQQEMREAAAARRAARAREQELQELAARREIPEEDRGNLLREVFELRNEGYSWAQIVEVLYEGNLQPGPPQNPPR